MMKNVDRITASVLFFVSLALYIRTLAPSLLYGDSAEFQAIAYTLGIGHPTGYFVYILFAKVFTFLPIRDVAYRVNLVSAFCAALMIALVYLLIRKLGTMVLPAVYGSLTLALMPLFWIYASVAEIYVPSAACLAFILFAVINWRESNNPRWLFVAGLFGALSLGIHASIALSTVGILLFLILSTRQRTDWLHALFGTILGIVIFLSSFLFLDFLNSPAGYYNTVVIPSLSVWDMVPADFDAPLERLAFLYFPPQFKGQFFNVPLDESLARLTNFADEASWTLWIALLGFISLFIPRKESRSRWREAILLMLAFVAFLTFAATYNVYDFHVYYIPAIVILAVFASLGVNAIVELFTLIPKAPRLVPVGVSIAILALGLYPSLKEAASVWDERIPPGQEDVYFYEYSDQRRLEVEGIVNSLEDNAILFTDWDYAYDFYYVAHILQGHTGISFHETYPQENVYQLADSAFEYIEANIDSRPIYFSERPSSLASKFKITRTDLGLFRIEKKVNPK